MSVENYHHDMEEKNRGIISSFVEEISPKNSIILLKIASWNVMSPINEWNTSVLKIVGTLQEQFLYHSLDTITDLLMLIVVTAAKSLTFEHNW